MTIEKRRKREIEKMRELILKAASDIMISEGFDKLSIRKIAKRIEYSPSIIELTAQMNVVSTLGLIYKIIIEKDITDEQREKLINFYSNEIVLRIANGKTLN